MKNKKILYSFLLVSFIAVASLILIQNSQKPKFLVAGTIEASHEVASDLSLFPYVFFAVHPPEATDEMPLAMARFSIRHDFSKGAYHFVLNSENLFSAPKRKKIPEDIKLKVIFSKTERISFGSDPKKFSKELKGLKKGDSHLKVLF